MSFLVFSFLLLLLTWDARPGSIMTLWMSEQMDKYGLGDGVSLFIVSQVVNVMFPVYSQMISASIFQFVWSLDAFWANLPSIGIVLGFCGVVVAAAYILEGRTDIAIEYFSRQSPKENEVYKDPAT